MGLGELVTLLGLIGEAGEAFPDAEHLAFTVELERGIAGVGEAAAALRGLELLGAEGVAADGARSHAWRAGERERGDERALMLACPVVDMGTARDRVEAQQVPDRGEGIVAGAAFGAAAVADDGDGDAVHRPAWSRRNPNRKEAALRAPPLVCFTLLTWAPLQGEWSGTGSTTRQFRPGSRAIVHVPQAICASPGRRRRRMAMPIPPKPSSISAQVAGSGTAAIAVAEKVVTRPP